MNLYEVFISGTTQKIKASKPEVAINQALRTLKFNYYNDSNISLNQVLKQEHSIHLGIDIKNLGKMVRIQKKDNQFTRQYVLKSDWEVVSTTTEHSTYCQCFSCEWEVCPDARTTRNAYQFHPVYNL